MCMGFALHVDHNYQRQAQIAHKLMLLGFELHKASSVQAAKDMLQKQPYELVLINFDTIGSKIFSLFSLARSVKTDAIIIAMMNKPNIRNEVQLFDAGINDVVVGKQTCAIALVSRIGAHLFHKNKPPYTPPKNRIILRGTIVDLDSGEVFCNGTVRRLPVLAVDLLKYFSKNCDRVISREELLESIWSDRCVSFPKEGGKTIDMAVSKLRKLIEPDPANPQIIVAVRGMGWKLAREAIGYADKNKTG